MLRKAHRLGLLAAGVVATLLAVVGVALIFHADAQVVGSVVARPLSWMPPLVVAAVITAVSWILLSQRRPPYQDDQSFTRARCSSCEREVLGRWRMCPYCGAMLKASTTRTMAGSRTDH